MSMQKPSAKKKEKKKAHLTAPELRPCNMCNNFHIYQRFSWVLKFSVEHTRLEPEEISNIHLHQHNKCLNPIDMIFAENLIILTAQCKSQNWLIQNFSAFTKWLSLQKFYLKTILFPTTLEFHNQCNFHMRSWQFMFFPKRSNLAHISLRSFWSYNFWK